MSKWFYYVLGDLEQYNPEDEFSDLVECSTFDDNGEYHSYDDKPSLVLVKDDRKLIYWHSHGEMFREGDKPSYINVSPESYSTYDSNNLLHSYNGMPSMIKIHVRVKLVTARWTNHGLEHRPDYLPSEITIDQVNISKESRSDNKFVTRYEDRNEWHVLGYLHNDKGVSIEKISNYKKANNKWALFGVTLTQEDFRKIKTFQRRRKTPLWLSFLHVVGLLNYSQVAQTLDNANHLEKVPLSWVLRSLGLNDEIYSNHINKLISYPRERPHSLKAIEEITEFSNEVGKHNA